MTSLPPHDNFTLQNQAELMSTYHGVVILVLASLFVLGLNLNFVCGLVKFVPTFARLVCLNLIGSCYTVCSANGPSIRNLTRQFITYSYAKILDLIQTQ